MPLQRGEPEKILKRLKPQRQDYGEAWRELVGQSLEVIDRQLRSDVEKMYAFKEFAPLPDGDRVILRNRVLFLFAEHQAIRGNIDVPVTWSWAQFKEAMLHYDGQDYRCDRSETEIKLLNALVEYYAEQVVRTRLGAGANKWIELTTRDMLDDLRLPKEEFPAVRNIVRGVANAEMVRILTKMGQLEATPTEIRKAPFKTFR